MRNVSYKKIILFLISSYFVSMMIVLGNGSSFLGRSLGKYYTPIANLIGLNTTWNFFSPDPAHTMYLNYVIHFEDEYGNPTKEPFFEEYPPESEMSDFSVHVRRKSYVMRFFASSQDRLQTYFIPWVCKQNPGATKIQIEVVVNKIPSLDVASTLKGTHYEDLIKQEEINKNVYSCP